MALLSLAPNPWFLAAGVALDLLLGDPEYQAHPVRLIGWSLTRTENLLRGIGLDGYGGGIALFLILCVVWVGGVSVAIAVLPEIPAAVIVDFSGLQPVGASRSAAAWLERGARRGPGRSAGGAGGDLQISGTRHRQDGCSRLCPRGDREPDRKPHRRFHQPGVLVHAWRAALPRAVQSGEHHGFDGWIQIGTVPALRMVRRADATIS